ncbi:MAG TPA: DUF3303 family protein [Acidobacteriaceae bacterium]|jgi:hypothetical protein|nr:DUF3303 family protein [Acidobacteriaceae bacterium]
MKVMSTYAIRPGCVPEAAQRFLGGKATPPTGVKILGRWHKADASGGFTLFETDDPAKLYEFAASWTDVLENHSTVVIEDAEAGAALGKIYGK